MYLLVAKQLIIMMLIALAGFTFAKCFKIGEAEQKFLSKLLLYLINPCLILNSFNKEFDAAKLKNLLIVMGIAVLIHVATMLVATVSTITKNAVKKAYASVDRLAIVFTNCGFIGIPLISNVFGKGNPTSEAAAEAVFYLMGFLVVFNIGLWTYGYHQMCGKINFKKIITNVNIIAVILGIGIFCMPFTLPKFISTPIEMIGGLNTATAMILIGLMFANFKLPAKTNTQSKEETEVTVSNAEAPVELSTKSYILMLIRTIFVRLVASSFVSLAILYAAYKILGPDSRTYIMVVYICSLCPSATSVPSLSCIFEKDTTYASLLVSLTSVLCIVTIPLFVALGEMLIK